MNDRESKLLNRIVRPNCAIEQSADEIEQSKTQNSLTKDDLGKFQQELRRDFKTLLKAVCIPARQVLSWIARQSMSCLDTN